MSVIAKLNIGAAKTKTNKSATFEVYHNTAEAEIIAGCKKGKRKYQDKLYNQYSGAMLGVAMRYCSNKTEAEDALQEAFLKIFKNIPKFEGQREGSLTAWIKTIVVNTSLSLNRKNKKHNYTEDVDDYRIADENAVVFFMSDDQDQKVRQQQILSAVQSLPTGYRTVFNLYIMEGYTHGEISEILDISENTSKSQLSKARKHLKNVLGYNK